MTPNDIFDSESTICAVSTPHGCGGIAVIRVSGDKAIEIVQRVWRGKNLTALAGHSAHFGEIVDPEHPDDVLDECIATLFRGPRSFTGEDTVELSIHGSRWIQREVLALLVRQGARLALPGEYTRRAMLNGRLDLAQAEAVADIIASSSRAAHRLAATQLKGVFSQRLASLRERLLTLASLLELELDFSEEDVEFADRSELYRLSEEIAEAVGSLHKSYSAGAAIKDGIPVAIAGATNAGKSSLLNRLLSDDRAIVSDIHGTTRDTIEETLEVGDYLFRFIDTAGLRDTTDRIEQLGIERSLAAIDKARIVILVVDPQSPTPRQLIDSIRTKTDAAVIIFQNKQDITAPLSPILPDLPGATIVKGSAMTGEGVDDLLKQLVAEIESTQTGAEDGVMVTNARHAAILAEAHQSALKVMDSLSSSLPPEFTAQHLRQTISHLSAITGDIPTPEILNNIFTHFCIGK